jgi:hypothetical protein
MFRMEKKLPVALSDPIKHIAPCSKPAAISEFVNWRNKAQVFLAVQPSYAFSLGLYELNISDCFGSARPAFVELEDLIHRFLRATFLSKRF